MENLVFTQLSVPEIRQLFRQELEVFFAAKKQSDNSTKDADLLLTIEEAATFTHLTKPTLYSLVSRAEIPHMKKGKRLYFSMQELTLWIKSGRKKTVKEIAAETEVFLGNRNPSNR